MTGGILWLSFTGAHHTGKTEAARALAAALERELADRRPRAAIRILTSGNANCPHPLNRDATPETQRWIMERIAREREAVRVESTWRGHERTIAVRDRTELDPDVYSLWLNANSPALRGRFPVMEPIELRHRLTGGQLVFWRRPDGRPIEADGKRDPSPGFQAEIDSIFAGRLRELIINEDPDGRPRDMGLVSGYNHSTADALLMAMRAVNRMWPEWGR